MNPEEFKRRTKELGLAVIKLVDSLPRRGSAQTIGTQLLRAAKGLSGIPSRTPAAGTDARSETCRVVLPPPGRTRRRTPVQTRGHGVGDYPFRVRFRDKYRDERGFDYCDGPSVEYRDGDRDGDRDAPNVRSNHDSNDPTSDGGNDDLNDDLNDDRHDPDSVSGCEPNHVWAYDRIRVSGHV